VPQSKALRASFSQRKGQGLKSFKPPRHLFVQVGLVSDVEFKLVSISTPKDANVILGQSHFIKTVEDLYETLVESSPGIKFGLAFCESSGKALVRSDGNDEELKKAAEENALALSCGHCFIVFLRNAFPINVLNRIKAVSEVCTVYCASANPVQVVVGETSQGRGIMGVIDGDKQKGVETPADVEERKDLVKKFGYKR